MSRSICAFTCTAFVGTLLVAAPPQVIQPAKDGTVVERRTWTLGAEPHLKVRSDVGKVILEGWDKSEIELEATFEANRQGEHARLELDAEGTSLTLQSTLPKSRSWFSFFGKEGASCTLRLKVPRMAMVYTRSDVGSIEVNGLKGWLDLRSDVGHIVVTGLNGHDRGMSIATDVGKIRVDLQGAKGEIEARTDVGHINANTPGLRIDRQEHGLLRGTLNGGRASIRLRTDVGAITLQ